MFGRRKHAAATAAPAAPTPRLSDEQVFALVHGRIDALLGAAGGWTVVRRTANDTDTLFHDVLTHSIATEITAALRQAQERLTTPAEPARAAEHVAEPQPDAPAVARAVPIALDWQPAPITVWTDLKKPVTGEIALGRLVA